MAFYAMSRGTELFTETGYKSIFVSNNNNTEKEDVEIFIKRLLFESDIDLDNLKKNDAVQLAFSF